MSPVAFVLGQGGEYIGVDEGLSQGLIVHSIQDAEGFLWFGTLSGLNRYDGRNFKTFYNDPFDPNSLRNDRIFEIADAGDFLLISTEAGGLDAYQKKTGLFFPIPVENDTLGFGKLKFSRLEKEREGRWIGTCIDEKNQPILVRFQLSNKEGQGLVISALITILEDYSIDEIKLSSDSLFLFASVPDSLCKIDLRGNNFSRENLPRPGELKQSNFHVDDAGKLWFIGNNRIGYFAAGEWSLWTTDFPLSKRIGIVEGEHLIIPTKTKELLTFDFPLPPGEVLEKSKATHREVIEFANLRSPFTDASNVIWYGSNGRGLLKVDPRKKRFSTLFAGKSLRQAISLDAEGNVAVIINGQTLLSDGPNHSLTSTPDIWLSGSRLFVDEKGTEWLATGSGHKWELYKKEKEGEWNQVFVSPIPEKAPRINSFTRVQLGVGGNLWLASEGMLYRYAPGSSAPDQFLFPSAFTRRHRAIDLQITQDGAIWIATTIGLLKADVSADSVIYKTYTTGKELGKGLRNNKLSSLLIDPVNPNLLWISSLGGGLSQFNRRTETFTHWSRQSGQLSNDNVYGLLADDLGNIWWSSNQGLSRYNPKTSRFNHFNIHDGLPSNEFNQLAYAKGQDGKLYFGCVEGLVVFDPAAIVPNLFTPPAKIVSLGVNGFPWAALEGKKEQINDPAFLTSVELSYDQNSLEIEFVGLEFSAPKKQQFRFFLEGAEQGWGEPTSQNQVSYLNLQPGRYTFKVIAANGDGIWHEQPTELSIRISPPWWKTTGAYATYWLLGLLILGGITYFLLRRQSYRFRLELEQRETERLQELHRFRASLYQSVTHEFRSPLSVVNSVAREWLNRNQSVKDKQEANTILRSSQRMLNQVDRMLTVATVEKDKLPYHARMGDVPAFLMQMTEERNSTFKAAQLTLALRANPPEFVAAFDPYYLETILGNLLDNALKYSGEESKVELLFQVDEENGDMVFDVQDTGAGIAPALLLDIFERNVRTNSKAEEGRGFGIGLAYVRELVDRLAGTIKVESTLGEGTSFTVRLPIDQGVAVLVPTPDQVLFREVDNNDLVETKIEERLRLLVVEDNDELQHFLQSSLKKDFEVLIAANGELGCEIAREQVPDLIISDLVMPKLDGLQLVNQLKNDERTSHIPIILLTSKTGLENRLKGLARGANVYLGKPFDLRELRLNIKNLLEQQRRMREQYLLQSVAPATDLPKTDDPERHFLGKVRAIVLDHLDDEEFKVPDLAKRMVVSRSQLHNKLKALTGESTTLYVRRLRLAEARRLLLNETFNISEIAYATGFRYVQHFSRYYAEMYQESPTETRRKLEKGA